MLLSGSVKVRKENRYPRVSFSRSKNKLFMIAASLEILHLQLLERCITRILNVFVLSGWRTIPEIQDGYFKAQKFSTCFLSLVLIPNSCIIAESYKIYFPLTSMRANCELQLFGSLFSLIMLRCSLKTSSSGC